eukprot:TRINITY_DN28495_c0_g1_i1.p1 TRINITY_DN28495_c0_g1~~TRINITY_DN28495_c0_g1_i1.p1  ORF type:complete len:567 (-),score=94.28 TRINITY_DN28495_c0_g1_i1:210-1721(-)
MVPSRDESLGAEQMRHVQQAVLSMSGAAPAASEGGLGTMPQIDPSMVQAYMAHMCQYLQHGLAAQQQQGGVPGSGAGSMHGLPPMPYSNMPAPHGHGPQANSEPSISVSVEGVKFQYQLTQDDLLKVFSRYGKVRSIRVDEVTAFSKAGSSATITFTSFQDAQAAMTDLNGKVLNGLEGTLQIQWTTPPAPHVAPPYPGVPYPGWHYPSPSGAHAWPQLPPAAGVLEGSSHMAASAPPNGGVLQNAGVAASSVPVRAAVASSDHVSPGAAFNDDGRNMKSVRKYTCRFLIGIESDKDFQVARRIIGAKGANMKRIFKQTEAKLRLRGKGSGYCEGAGQKESTEPLQLCISCTNLEGYRSAVQQAQELLTRLYDDYQVYCREHGFPVPDLQLNLSENQLVCSASCVAAGQKDKGKRGRRSRGGRGRDGKTSSGEIDRGEPGPNAPDVEEIESIIDDRNEARRACNFTEADKIRERLVGRGVLLMDEPGGRGRGAEVTTWRYWRD